MASQSYTGKAGFTVGMFGTTLRHTGNKIIAERDGKERIILCKTPQASFTLYHILLGKIRTAKNTDFLFRGPQDGAKGVRKGA